MWISSDPLKGRTSRKEVVRISSHQQSGLSHRGFLNIYKDTKRRHKAKMIHELAHDLMFSNIHHSFNEVKLVSQLQDFLEPLHTLRIEFLGGR